MKPLPEDPMGQHNRFMEAFAEDILAGDYRAPRAKAVVEIAREMRAMRVPRRSGAVPAEPVPVSGLRPPAAIARGE